MRIGLGLGIGFVRARGMNAATFALSDAQWTLTERPEDANTQRVRIDVYAVPPAGKRFIWTRTPNADGIPTISNFGEYTEVSLGHYQSNAVNRTTAASENVRVFLVDVSAPSPVAWNNPLVTPVSLVRRFQPSGLPYAPTFTYFADGSGTAAQLRLDPRAVNEGNGRNGVTPWRAVDQLRWRIGTGAYTTISDASTIDLTGLSASQSVGVSAHNINGWGPETYVTVNAVLPALAAGDWTLVDAGDGANLIATVTNAPVSPTGAAPTGYEYTLNAGTTWTALPGGGAIPGAVGSNTCALRAVYDVGRSAASPSKTASILALSVFPEVVSGSLAKSRSTSSIATHTITMPTGYAVGDMILVQYCPDGTPTFTVPAGWNLIDPVSLSDPSQRWLWKFATSLSESLTFTLDASAVEAFAAMAIAIRNVKSGTTPVAGAIDQQYTATSKTFVAPAPSAYGSSVKGLYVVGIGRSGGEAAQTTAPTDFSGFDSYDCGSSGSATGIAQAWRQYEGTALPSSATWGVNTRYARTQIIGFQGAVGAVATVPSGASLTISPDSPVDGDTVTYTFAFAAGTTPITTSLTVGGTTTTNSTGVHTRVHAAGSYPYSYTSSNAGGAGPSGSGTLVVSAPVAVSASVALSPASPAAGQTVTATVTVSPGDAVAGLTVTNGGAAVSLTQVDATHWTFVAPATGTTTVIPRATYADATTPGTDVTFTTGAVVSGITNPTLDGVPEVGDRMTLLAGTGVAAPTYLIERTDNGGTTYATEKTAVAGEVFAVPATIGRQYRAVMLNGATRYPGDWTLPVAAGGPQMVVASIDGRTLSVTNPNSGSSLTVRARPYGGGTATTVTGTAATLTLVLPGDGCWQIDQSTDGGATYGPLAYRWCITVGLISYFGRNCATVAVDAAIDINPIIVTGVAGRQPTVDEITPVCQITQEAAASDASLIFTYYVHGVTKNLWAALKYNDQGHAAWDNRCFNDSGDKTIARRSVQETLQSFDPANLVTRWPQMLAVDDALIKCASGPDARYLGISQNHRHGLPDQMGGVALAATPPAAGQFIQQMARHGSWVSGYVTLPGLDDLISRFAAKGFSVAGMGVTAAIADGILARVCRFHPAMAFYRGGWHQSDSFERMTAYHSAYPATESNYYFIRNLNRMIFLASSSFVTNDWRAKGLRALASMGYQIDVPGKEAQIGAGIGVNHELPLVFGRLARNMSIADIPTSQPGNYTGMFIRVDAADAARFAPHSNYDYPYYSRWNEVRGYEPEVTKAGVVTGKYWLFVKARAQDGSKGRFNGLNIIRQINSDVNPVIVNYDADSYTGKGLCYRLTVDPSLFSVAPTVGELICMQPPAAIQSIISAPGYYEWDFSADPYAGTKLTSIYNPTATTSYRDKQFSHGLNWSLRIADAMPATMPWVAMEKYTARTALTAYPGAAAGWNHPFCEGNDFLYQMWMAYAASLGITTA